MTSALYPIPQNPDATKLIMSFARSGRDEHGTLMIDRALTIVERETINKRLHEITPHLAPAKPTELRKAIAAAFPGYDREKAKETAATLAKDLIGLPVFAVNRALSAALTTGKKLDGFELRAAADAIVRAPRDEQAIAALLLRAKAKPRKADASEAERVGAGLEALRARLESGEPEPRDDFEETVAPPKRLQDAAEQRLLREYEARGLEPVYADNGKGVLLSLPFLLSIGWTIEQAGGGNMLVRPNGIKS